MMWQDYALSILGILLTVAAVPSLFAKTKPSVITSAPVAVLLSLIGFTQLTLGLYLTAVTTFGTSAMWYVLWTQRLKQLKEPPTLIQYTDMICYTDTL